MPGTCEVFTALFVKLEDDSHWLISLSFLAVPVGGRNPPPPLDRTVPLGRYILGICAICLGPHGKGAPDGLKVYFGLYFACFLFFCIPMQMDTARLFIAGVCTQ